MYASRRLFSACSSGVSRTEKRFFEVKFINPSQELLKKIAWWEPPVTEERPISPPSDRSADIGV